MDVEINQTDAADAYLAHLNASFNGWGDTTRFRWVFERTAGAPTPDLMVLREGTEVLAGSAVSYRNAILANGQHERVGIMTGSWTLPASRGRGCFTRIIQESIELCRRCDAGLLLAFVTEDNASCRRLRAVGAVLVETSYWIVPPPDVSPPMSASLRVALGVPSDVLHRAHENRPGKGLRFTYDLQGYTGQFLQRPTLTEVVECDDGLAILERAPATDRVLALYPAPGREQALTAQVGAVAHSAGRTLFGFTGNVDEASWFASLNVAPKRGFMTVIATAGTHHPQPTSLYLENGDRM